MNAKKKTQRIQRAKGAESHPARFASPNSFFRGRQEPVRVDCQYLTGTVMPKYAISSVHLQRILHSTDQSIFNQWTHCFLAQY